MGLRRTAPLGPNQSQEPFLARQQIVAVLQKKMQEDRIPSVTPPELFGGGIVKFGAFVRADQTSLQLGIGVQCIREDTC